MALARPHTIDDVKGAKRVSTEVRASFMRTFDRWVKDSHGGNQTAAGKALGMTQSHVSALQSGARGPGIDLLIRLREVTGLTIDQLLGLEPVPPVLGEQDVRRLSREEYAALRAEDEAATRQLGKRSTTK